MGTMPTPTARLRAWRLSPSAFRRVAAWAVWAMALAMVSGAAVRLTGSGMGCSDWPTCSARHVVAPLAFHPWMEFGNRLLNVVVTLIAGIAIVAAWRRRPRRRDLTLLSGGLVLGVLGEAVVGGEVVLHHLAPLWVTGHFLLSMLLLTDAVVLRYRAGVADDTAGLPPHRARAAGPAQAVVGRRQEVLCRLMLPALAAVVILGTVVTSTGPHSGAPGTPRYHFSLHSVAQLHGSAVETLLALTLVSLWALHRGGAPAAVMRRAELMLVVMVAQAGIGYAQYFSGDPALVVGFHEAGAVSVVVAVLWFNLSLRARPAPVPPSAPTAASPAPAAQLALTSS